MKFIKICIFLTLFIFLLVTINCGDSSKKSSSSSLNEIGSKQIERSQIERKQIEESSSKENSLFEIPKFTVHFYLNKTNASLNKALKIPKPQKVAKSTKASKPKVSNEEAGFLTFALHGDYAKQETYLPEWINTEDGEKWDFNTPISQNVKLYAQKWLPKIVVKVVDSQKYPTNPIPRTNFDANLVSDINATNSNYKAYFDGWFKNKLGKGKAWDFNKKSKNDLVLYGRWSLTTYKATSGKARPNKYNSHSLYGLLYDSLKKDAHRTSIQPKQIDISEVNDLNFLFFEKDTFNEEIGGWNTENVIKMQAIFQGAKTFDKAIGGWNTQKVENMKAMFQYASGFNQSIGNWNTKNVQDMKIMFNGATNFNQDLSPWEIGKVQSIEHIFSYSAFNKDMHSWNWKPSCKLKKGSGPTPTGRTSIKNSAFGMFENSKIDGEVRKYPKFYNDLQDSKIKPEDTLKDAGSKNCTPAIL